MEYKITLFLKLGKEEYIDKLQKEGLLYCNTIKFFRTLERENVQLRRDTAEGAITSIKIDWMKLFIGQKELPIKITEARLNHFDPKKDLEHIYCLYAITPDLATGEPFIDGRNVHFGDAGLLILNPPEFIRRIKRAIRGKFKVDYNPVYYYTNNNDYQNLTVFHKQEYFSYQREFRLLFHYQNTEPLIISFGSLEDISVKIEASKLSELLLVREDNPKNS